MKNVKALIAVAIIATLFLSLVALSLAVDNDAISAEMLINNAERLDTLVKCRNSAIANSTDTASLGAIWQQILNFTSLGEKYLNASKAFYEAGNYTAAKIDAIWAIRSFGNALRLQSLVASSTGINFTACAAVVAPSPIANRTRLMNGTMLMNRTRLANMSMYRLQNMSGLQLHISLMEARVKALLNSSLAANDTQLREMLSKALQLLNSANESLAQGNEVRARELVRAAEKIMIMAQMRIRVNALKHVVERARKMGIRLNITSESVERYNPHKVFEEIVESFHRNMTHGIKPPVIMPHGHGHGHREKNMNPTIPGPVMPFNGSPFNETPFNETHGGMHHSENENKE